MEVLQRFAAEGQETFESSSTTCWDRLKRIPALGRSRASSKIPLLRYNKHARMSSRVSLGSFVRSSFSDWPAARSSRMNPTARRVPRITGLPARTSGSKTMRSD